MEGLQQKGYGDQVLAQQTEKLSKMDAEQIVVDPNYEIQHDGLFKVIIIGDSGVGKSCLMQRLTQSAFKSDHQITIGVEFGAFVLKLEGKSIIKLQIWDTAGQEQFRSITKLFYKNSQAAIVVYDVTKKDSFDSVSSWLNEIEENRDQEDMLVYLVGNRVDLGEDVRQVSHAQAVQCVREKRLDNFFETSAKTGLNVSELFVSLTKHLYLSNKSKLDQFREKEDNDLGLSAIGNGNEFRSSAVGLKNIKKDQKRGKAKKKCC